MRTISRVVGAGLVVLAFGWLLVGIRGRAGEDKKTQAEVLKIAAAHAKGAEKQAQTTAQALAKQIEDVGDVMDLLKPRTKGGLGVGPTPDAIKPDGVEQLIIALAKDGITPGKLAKHAQDLEQMAYLSAAVMDVALAKVPEKDEGDKTRKLWTDSAKQAHDAALELARAARGKNVADVRKAVERLNTGCNNCHAEFR
jgi:hypothetical protein